LEKVTFYNLMCLFFS